MPLIPEMILDGAVFLFRTRDEAANRARLGGTGFVAAKEIAGSEQLVGEKLYVPYVVTNRHVVFSGGASVISVNRLDGKPPDILEYEPTDWVSHPQGDDLAAICVFADIDRGTHKTSHLADHQLITQRDIAEYKIGVGDEVFMVGRFINHQGHNLNRPAARFGSISMMQERIWIPSEKRWRDSFAVEMRSRTGFSGSPVAVYRTPNTLLSQVPAGKEMFFGLLGVNWGYILDEDGENTWLNGVVPAWKILELWEAPALKAKHQEIEADLPARVRAALPARPTF